MCLCKRSQVSLLIIREWQVWSLTFGETLHDKVYSKYTGVKEEKSATAYVGHELGRAAIFLATEPIIIALALTTTFLFG